MYPDSSDGLNIETKDEIYFFATSFGMFDNFSPHKVKIWGQDFQTSEHAFQWKKFSVENPNIAKDIFNAPSPFAAKKYLMQINHFNQRIGKISKSQL